MPRLCARTPRSTGSVDVTCQVWPHATESTAIEPSMSRQLPRSLSPMVDRSRALLDDGKFIYSPRIRVCLPKRRTRKGRPPGGVDGRPAILLSCRPGPGKAKGRWPPEWAKAWTTAVRTCVHSKTHETAQVENDCFGVVGCALLPLCHSEWPLYSTLWLCTPAEMNACDQQSNPRMQKRR